MKNFLKILIVLFGTVTSEVYSKSHEHPSADSMGHNHQSHKHPSLPIGLMGNMHQKGFMFSIRQGLMRMKNNILDGNNISNSEILSMSNETGNNPSNLSIVPENMDSKMTMAEGMYAVSNNLTLMVMATYLSKEMNLSTYSPHMDKDLIGKFNTSTSDLSDVTASAFFKIRENSLSKWQGEISYQKSIGSIDETGEVITPMSMRVEKILPYAMQSGDGATRLVFGLTNTRRLNEQIVFGNQIRRKIVVDDLSWSFGNQTEVNSWIQYSLSEQLSFSSRLKFLDKDRISGSDPLIVAPVQTADPDNYGGKEIHFGFGVNLTFDIFPGGKDLIGIELLAPLMQDKSNLQMKTDYQFVIGYQKHL